MGYDNSDVTSKNILSHFGSGNKSLENYVHPTQEESWVLNHEKLLSCKSQNIALFQMPSFYWSHICAKTQTVWNSNVLLTVHFCHKLGLNQA